MRRQPGQYQRIVDRALRVTRRRTEEPIRIAKICHTVGVSARTLLRAFRAVHGATPYRYLCSLRLLEARRMLSSATGKPPTVTEVATRFGFVELGRFAVAYRSAFGESPSDTLRRSFRSRPESASHPAPIPQAIEPPTEPKRCAVLCGAEE
jgi:transcriptional regulator GlxA family with amidase domain